MHLEYLQAWSYMVRQLMDATFNLMSVAWYDDMSLLT